MQGRFKEVECILGTLLQQELCTLLRQPVGFSPRSFPCSCFCWFYSILVEHSLTAIILTVPWSLAVSQEHLGSLDMQPCLEKYWLSHLKRCDWHQIDSRETAEYLLTPSSTPPLPPMTKKKNPLVGEVSSGEVEKACHPDSKPPSYGSRKTSTKQFHLGTQLLCKLILQFRAKQFFLGMAIHRGINLKVPYHHTM